MNAGSIKNRLALACLATLATSAGALAQASGAVRTLGELVAGADLVFHGEVVGIEYANSAPAADAPGGIPHTFVTYRVDEVLHGVNFGGEVTLRFMGGWDPTTQTYLQVSLAPEFDLGDEDILFVRGNGRLGAPLVGNRDGRLRVSDGQVYSDTGRSVRLDASGRISLGQRYSVPGVGSVDVRGHTLWVDIDPESVAGPSDAVTGAVFADAVARVAAQVASPRAPFVSVRADAAFDSPFPEPAPMVERVVGPADTDELDPEIIAEILADESGLAEQYRERIGSARAGDR